MIISKTKYGDSNATIPFYGKLDSIEKVFVCTSDHEEIINEGYFK